MRCLSLILISALSLAGCKKSGGGNNPGPTPPTSFSFNSLTVNGQFNGFNYNNINLSPVVKLSFQAPLDKTSVPFALSFRDNSGNSIGYQSSYENNDSTIVIQPGASLGYLTKYTISVSKALKSKAGGGLLSGVDVTLTTYLDSTAKFPLISDDSLLSLVQKQTFKYFWDFGHPVSGLARERNSSGDIVTSGGSGFGIMAMIVAGNRGFITHDQALTRMQTIVSFLKNTAQKFHGAFPHWLNGNTGLVVPFSTKDNGADLVETSYLVAGLLCARQYFNSANAAEATLRSDINSIVDGVEWSWFRKSNENVLYWHWSPNYNWDMNLPIRGWNECLITYVLAASSKNYSIPKIVYDNGWARNGTIKNGQSYYGLPLPLGDAYGGPLFFSHYSFLGINPNGLSDAYADYKQQVTNHSLINYNYCKANPKGYLGYSSAVWGLTASDIPNSYTASSPTNDVGVIAPTAAISSIPYTPVESMNALKFFYYTLGDKIWKQYGFVDAFSLDQRWFADSFLAIDQGPMIVMIENYRTGLIWNLFTGCPEIKAGMQSLGFTAPYL